MTIHRIVHLADSMLTHCHRFETDDYLKMDKTIMRLDREFWCSGFPANSLNSMILRGCRESPYYLSSISLSRTFALHNLGSYIPNEFSLNQNYPNPFNPTTTIEFNLVEPSVVTLKVYNMLGGEVATLLENEAMDEGLQSIESEANSLASVVYFYTMIARGEHQQQFQATKRMVLLK